MASVLINGYKGSIYPERHPGTGKITHYTGVLDLGYHPNGKRNRPKRKGSSRAAVKEKLADLAKDLDKGIAATQDKTVSKVVTEYIDDLERQGRAPKTIEGLRSLHRNHITKIGALKVKSELTPAQVSEWMVDISENLSTKTIVNVHGLLSGALDRTMTIDEITDRNVSRMVSNIQGKKKGRESKSFTPDQVRVILARASAGVPFRLRFGAFVILALTTGLRGDEFFPGGCHHS